MRTRAAWKRLGRWTLRVMGGLLVFVVLALLVILSGPGRQRVLDGTLRQLDAALPGELRVEHASWSLPLKLELQGILWTDASDTLLSARRLRVGLDLSSLAGRDVVVPELRLEGVRADVARVQGAFIDSTATPPQEPDVDSAGGLPWPLREGSLPGVPSLQVELVAIDLLAERIEGEDTRARARLEGSLDLRRGRTPAVGVSALALTVPHRELALRSDELHLDLARKAWSGHLRGQYTPHWDFRLEAETQGDVRSLVLAESSAPGPPESMGLRLSWEPEGDDPFATGALSLVLRTPSSERLREDPRLAAVVDSLPGRLPPLVLRAEGRTTLTPDFATALDVEIEPSDLFDEARVRTDFREGTLRIEDLVLRGDGLEITGRGERDPDRQEFELRGRLTSLGWLEQFVAPPPVSAVDLGFDLSGGGPREATDLRLRLDGSATVQERPIEDLRLVARARLRETTEVDFDLGLATRPVRAGWGGHVSVGDSIVASMTPLVLRSWEASLAERSLERVAVSPADQRARIVARPERSRVDVRGLRIEGDAGRLRASGWFEPDAGADLQARLRTPVAPSIFEGMVSPELAAQLDSVAWDLFELDLSTEWRPKETTESLVTELRLRAPGPDRLGPLLPPDLNTEGLDDLRFDMDVTASRPTGGEWNLSSRLDLTPTSWIGGRPLQVTYRGGAVFVDSLSLQLLGIDLRGSARTENDSLRGSWTLAEIDDTTVRQRWRSLPEDLEFALRGHGSVEGTRERPRARTEILARVRQGSTELPRVELMAETGGADLERARIHFGEGIRGLPVVLRTLDVGVQAAPDSLRHPGLLDHWVSVQATGPGLEWSQVARVQVDSLVQVRTDTLAVQWRDRDLRARSPFRLRWDGSRRRVGVEGLDLEGSLGQVVADGFVEPDTSDIDARLVLLFPPYPEDALRSLPRPDEIRAGVRSTARGGFDITLDAGDLVLGEPDPMDLAVRGHVGDSTYVDLRLGPAEGPPRLRAEITLSTPPGAAPSTADRLRGFVEVDGLALPRQAGAVAQMRDEWLRGESENPPRIDTRVDLSGTMAAPVIDADGRLFFPQGWRLSQDEVRFLALVDSGGTVDTELDWKRQGRSLLTATAHLEDHDDDADTPARIRAAVRTERFDLADLDPVLPPRAAVRGRLGIDISAEGDVAQPVLTGSIKGRELFVRMVDGSQARAHADLRFEPASGGGTHATGTVRIDQGRIQIPEGGRNLAPKDGPSLLWHLEGRTTRPVGRNDLELSAADSVAQNPGQKEAKPKAVGPPLLQADVTVSIPNGIWIRGRGIEIEMGGELQVEFAGEQPVLVGTLQARSGSLSLVGQRFTLQRGEVVFYGGDAINPALDIVLGLEKDGVEVRVLLQGTARDPKLSLESDPPMPEADIFSHLLFGKNDDNLSGGQDELLRSETARALQAFAIPAIERQLSDTLGLDMVRIGQGSQDSSSQALMAGKYLSPRVLLSYEQSLEEGDSFFVNLRYWITRDLTLESRLGRSDPSSVQLNWSVDY